MSDKYVENFIARMKSYDPNYGNEEHQRLYIEKLRAVAIAFPCARDHSNDNPPEHVLGGKERAESFAEAAANVCWPAGLSELADKLKAVKP